MNALHCTVAALAAAAFILPADAAVNLRMLENWRTTVENQIRSEAARNGVEMSNVVVKVDIRRKLIGYLGSVETPDDVRKLIEIAESSGFDKGVENQLTVKRLPVTWPALLCTPRAGLGDVDKAAAVRAIGAYDTLIKQYNDLACTVQPTDPQLRRTWLQIVSAESEFIHGDRIAITNAVERGLAETQGSGFDTNQLMRDAATVIRKLQRVK
ncbi:hypothetical protein GX586_00260 [bacterium]|nr:hypothetical protein [bacterium]